MLTTEIKTREDIQELCIEFIRHSEGVASYNEQAQRVIKNQDYYRGIVWTEDEYNAYVKKGTIPVSINRCRPLIKALVGIYLDNLREPSVTPRKSATESMARVWTEVIKHAMDTGGGDDAWFNLFFEGNKDSRSCLWIERQEDGSPGGKLAFGVDGFFSTTIDPNCDVYNVSDPNRGAKYVFRTQWIDREIIEQKWPDRVADFERGVVTYQGVADPTGVYRYLTNHLAITDEKNFRWPVYVVWWRQPSKGFRVVDKKTGASRIVTTRRIKKQRGYDYEKTPTFVLHRSIMVGYTLAEDEANPFGDEVTEYPCFQYVPYFEPDAQYGSLDDARDLNKEVCVRRTEALRLLKQVINVGFKVKGGTPVMKQWLADNGSTNGLVIDESEFAGGVERLQPNMPSTGDILLGDKADLDIDKVSQVNEEMRGAGTGRKETVGVTEMRLNQGIKANLMVLRNFWQTMELAGNWLLRVIRKTDIYTVDEVRMIVSKSSLIDKKVLGDAEGELKNRLGGASLPPMMIPPQPNPALFQMAPPERHAEIFTKISDGIKAAGLYNEQQPGLKAIWDDVVKLQAINTLLDEMRDDDLADYGLKVIVSAATPSTKILNWLKEQDLMDRYPGLIPPDIFVEDSGIPRAEEIVSRMRDTMQQRQMIAPPSPQGAPAAGVRAKTALAGAA